MAPPIADPHLSVKHLPLQTFVASVLCLFLLFHGLVLLVYNAPKNLLDPLLAPIVDAYVRPYLSQSWSLFAPTPGGMGLDYRYRYRFSYASGPVVTTNFLRGSEVFPSSLSRNPLNSLDQFRHISYACMTLAEAAVVRHQPHTDPKFVTVDAASLGAPLSCLGRLTLALAEQYRPSLPATAQLRATIAVQITLLAREAVRAQQFYEPSRRNRVPEERVIYTTPWMTSTPVAPYVDQLAVKGASSQR